jgi:hypothetical protein
MRKKRHTPEPIIGKLREAEVALSQGAKVPEACRKLGVTEQWSYPSSLDTRLDYAACRSSCSFLASNGV